MLAATDGGVGEVLAGEHPADGHLRPGAAPRRAALPQLRQVLLRAGAHGARAAAHARTARLRRRPETVGHVQPI